MQTESFKKQVDISQDRESWHSVRENCIGNDKSLHSELKALERSFKGLNRDYYLVDKIGEGTFSSVYKAIDKHYGKHNNSWDTIYNEDRTENGLQYVALKRIYVTASPRRILNELKLLRKLSGSSHVTPIITAMRYQDQILVVLPFFQHADFRHYYRHLTIPGVRKYMHDLLSGLEFIHSKRVIHRDIKPANFLFDVNRGYGVLVDFGLAEMETEISACPCASGGLSKRLAQTGIQGGYRKDDRRPGRHANRAGTRGFRAPEVLLRCTGQTTKIDMWSVGVILLSIMTRRLPFFNSADDEDALLELATIWGKQQVNICALLHGLILETSVPTIPDTAYSLDDIVGCFSGRPATSAEQPEFEYNADEQQLLLLLKGLLELNFKKRFSATKALNHQFFATPVDSLDPLIDRTRHKSRKSNVEQEYEEEIEEEDEEDHVQRESTEPIHEGE